MRGEFLDVPGGRLYYYAAGSRGAGEPVVLIHGFPSSGHLWRSVVPLLPAGHRIIVADLLGYGRSDPARRERMDIAAHASRLVSMLDELGVERAALVGHELGGGVAQALALDWPDRVSRVCLVSSVAFAAWPIRILRVARALLPLTRQMSQSVLRSFLRSELIRGFADRDVGSHDLDVFLRAFESDEGRDTLIAHIAALECSATRAMASRFGTLRVPAAVVWGANDPLHSRHVGERLAAAIPGSTLTVVPDARHFVPLDTPHAVARAIATLLAR
jgi:pimeloyl-ACP methyl ester carboxylesterase